MPPNKERESERSGWREWEGGRDRGGDVGRVSEDRGGLEGDGDDTGKGASKQAESWRGRPRVRERLRAVWRGNEEGRELNVDSSFVGR